jgi:hypothetical protein
MSWPFATLKLCSIGESTRQLPCRHSCSDELGESNVSVSEYGFVYCRSREHRIPKNCAREVGASEVRPCEIGARKVASTERSTCKSSVRKILINEFQSVETQLKT